MVCRLFGILALCFGLASTARAETMFEGYYRINLDGKSIGYTIQRYEFEPKTKSFSCTTFLRAKFGETLVQESLKGRATDRFRPVAYQYTSLVGEQKKTIDATFNGLTMTQMVTEGKPVGERRVFKIPEGTFLSCFLPYMLLKKKFEINKAFKYSAVAEEDGNSYWGTAGIESVETKKEFTVYQVLNKFKGEDFSSQLAVVTDPKDPTRNIRGEVIETSSPAKKITTRLMSTAAEATAGHLVPNKILVALFGGMPIGKLNLIATPPVVESAPVVIPTPVPPEKPGK